jgi:hypothetical protein
MMDPPLTTAGDDVGKGAPAGAPYISNNISFV